MGRLKQEVREDILEEVITEDQGGKSCRHQKQGAGVQGKHLGSENSECEGPGLAGAQGVSSQIPMAHRGFILAAKQDLERLILDRPHPAAISQTVAVLLTPTARRHWVAGCPHQCPSGKWGAVLIKLAGRSSPGHHAFAPGVMNSAVTTALSYHADMVFMTDLDSPQPTEGCGHSWPNFGQG